MRESSSTYASRIRRFRLPRLCIAVVGADAPTMVERAESLVRDNPFLEFRLDYLSQPLAALPKLKNFPGNAPRGDLHCDLSSRRKWWQVQRFGRQPSWRSCARRPTAASRWSTWSCRAPKTLKADDLHDLSDRVGHDHLVP